MLTQVLKVIFWMENWGWFWWFSGCTTILLFVLLFRFFRFFYALSLLTKFSVCTEISLRYGEKNRQSHTKLFPQTLFPDENSSRQAKRHFGSESEMQWGKSHNFRKECRLWAPFGLFRGQAILVSWKMRNTETNNCEMARLMARDVLTVAQFHSAVFPTTVLSSSLETRPECASLQVGGFALGV